MIWGKYYFICSIVYCISDMSCIIIYANIGLDSSDQLNYCYYYVDIKMIMRKISHVACLKSRSEEVSHNTK